MACRPARARLAFPMTDWPDIARAVGIALAAFAGATAVWLALRRRA